MVCIKRQSSGELLTFLRCLIERLPLDQILLSIAAVVSLALGLFQDFGTPRPAGEPPIDWVEGVAIMIAIIIVVSTTVYHISANPEYYPVLQVGVGSLNDWQKERQFQSLNRKKDIRNMKVIRDGTEKLIDIKVEAFYPLYLPNRDHYF